MTESRPELFTEFFQIATDGLTPYRWQIQVAVDGLPDVLPIPSGLGKTEVALAWAWRLLLDKKPEPLHLVVCLPMRSLVTQTVQRLETYFRTLKRTNPAIDIAVHQLMGGAIDDEWAGQPDKPWVLVGTQDQLLSRALNRGYAMSRFEWPVHFGLLNNDCRWLIDEVQLMGPGLWTTSQLDWMRRKRFPSLKPCLTTWMSATVGTAFLSTTDRVREALSELSPDQVAFEEKLKSALDSDMSLGWWRHAARPVEWWQPAASRKTTTGAKKPRAATSGAVTPEAIAAAVVEKHVTGTLSLVICNTVDMAREVFRAILPVEHKVLLASRFRHEDRCRHERRFHECDADRKAGTAHTYLESTAGECDDAFGVWSGPNTIAIGYEQWPLDSSIAKGCPVGRWESSEFVLSGHGRAGLVANPIGSLRLAESSNAGVVPKGEPRQLGPFTLACLEGSVRVCDWRVSESPSANVKPSEVRRGKVSTVSETT